MRRAQPSRPVDACRWSVPAFRPSLLSNDDDAFERYWLCERTKAAVPVTQADCTECRYWTPEPAPLKLRKRLVS